MTKWSRWMLAVTVSVAVAFGVRATPATASTDWTWPVEGHVITPYLNDNDHPYAGGMHRGIDIASPVGARVVAARAGTVTFAGSAASSGLTVAIATSDGLYATSYLHLSRVAVSDGAVLETGDEVGAVGTTGTRSASEPHLHFGVRRAGEPSSYIDPLSLLPPLPTPNRALPPTSVPVRDQVRAGPAPATTPPTLTVPLGHPLPARARVPERAGAPEGSPIPVLRGRPQPALTPAPSASGAPGPSVSGVPVAGPGPGTPHPRTWSGPAGLGPVAGHAREQSHGQAGPRAPAAPHAAGDSLGAWGRLIGAAGIALLVVAGGGHRVVRRLLTRLRRQSAQRTAERPARPAPVRVVGLSQMG
jgi:peptidase M23-like protein